MSCEYLNWFYFILAERQMRDLCNILFRGQLEENKHLSIQEVSAIYSKIYMWISGVCVCLSIENTIDNDFNYNLVKSLEMLHKLLILKMLLEKEEGVMD